MYRTMIINTITSREDRATITAIIGVSSEIKRTKHVVTVVYNGWKAQVSCSEKYQDEEEGLIQFFCRKQGINTVSERTSPIATPSLTHTFVYCLPALE